MVYVTNELAPRRPWAILSCVCEYAVVGKIWKKDRNLFAERIEPVEGLGLGVKTRQDDPAPVTDKIDTGFKDARDASAFNDDIWP